MSKIAQGRAWQDSMRRKTKVLVARAANDLATTLKQANEFVGFQGDEDEPIIGTADMQLVACPGGSVCYVNNVCVDPCARKRGVARAMMDVVDVLATSELGAGALALHVDVANTPAVRLYERCDATRARTTASFTISSVRRRYLCGSVGFYDMTDPALVELFSSDPFCCGDEDPQRLMIKPLAVAAPPPTAGAAAPYAMVVEPNSPSASRMEIARMEILAMSSPTCRSSPTTSRAAPDPRLIRPSSRLRAPRPCRGRPARADPGPGAPDPVAHAHVGRHAGRARRAAARAREHARGGGGAGGGQAGVARRARRAVRDHARRRGVRDALRRGGGARRLGGRASSPTG